MYPYLPTYPVMGNPYRSPISRGYLVHEWIISMVHVGKLDQTLLVGVFAFDYPLSNVQNFWLTFQLNPDWVQVPGSLKSQCNYIGIIYPPIIEQNNQGRVTAHLDQWILFGSFALKCLVFLSHDHVFW